MCRRSFSTATTIRSCRLVRLRCSHRSSSRTRASWCTRARPTAFRRPSRSSSTGICWRFARSSPLRLRNRLERQDLDRSPGDALGLFGVALEEFAAREQLGSLVVGCFGEVVVVSALLHLHAAVFDASL